MKKVIAFLTALLLAGGTILSLHFWAEGNTDFDNPEFDYWTAEQKFRSPDVIRDNLDANTLIVMASSELQHGVNTPYHPQNMFLDTSFHTMLIGAGHYQCLEHAITLAALDPSMRNRKAALLVSPQWFVKKGTTPKEFSSNFSESSYIDMIENEHLSNQTKEYLTDRSIALLKADKPMQKRVKSYQKIYNGDASHFDYLKYNMYKTFLKDKQRQSILLQAFAEGIGHGSSRNIINEVPDWEALYAQAEIDGRNASTNNEFQISNKYFNWKIKPKLAKRKGSSAKSSYSKSPEYNDLRAFLEVCEDLGIEPMLVLLPVNGKWYDYTQFPRERLTEFYQNVEMMAAEYPKTTLISLADDSYKDYYMEDTIHIGWKGWVKVNEALYNFGTETK